MKKIVLLFVSVSLFCILCTNKLVFSQDDVTVTYSQGGGKGEVIPQNIIKTSLLSPLWFQIPFTGEYRLVYERVVNEKIALYLGVGYVGKSALLIGSSSLTSDSAVQGLGIGIAGFRVHGGGKLYLTDFPAPKGFYIGPHFSYNTAKFFDKSQPNDYLKATFINFNVLVGYQFIVGGGFAFDMFSGFGYKINTWVLNIENSTIFNDELLFDRFGVKFNLGFNLGYAF